MSVIAPKDQITTALRRTLADPTGAALCASLAAKGVRLDPDPPDFLHDTVAAMTEHVILVDIAGRHHRYTPAERSLLLALADGRADTDHGVRGDALPAYPGQPELRAWIRERLAEKGWRFQDLAERVGRHREYVKNMGLAGYPSARASWEAVWDALDATDADHALLGFFLEGDAS